MTEALASTVRRIAASYPQDAAVTPLRQRIAHFTAVQHFAWVERFAPGTATLAEIQALHSWEGTR